MSTAKCNASHLLPPRWHLVPRTPLPSAQENPTLHPTFGRHPNNALFHSPGLAKNRRVMAPWLATETRGGQGGEGGEERSQGCGGEGGEGGRSTQTDETPCRPGLLSIPSTERWGASWNGTLPSLQSLPRKPVWEQSQTAWSLSTEQTPPLRQTSSLAHRRLCSSSSRTSWLSTGDACV